MWSPSRPKPAPNCSKTTSESVFLFALEICPRNWFVLGSILVRCCAPWGGTKLGVPAPKWEGLGTQDRPKRPQERHKWPKDRHKSPPGHPSGPKIASDGIKIAPRGSPKCSQWAQDLAPQSTFTMNPRSGKQCQPNIVVITFPPSFLVPFALRHTPAFKRSHIPTKRPGGLREAITITGAQGTPNSHWPNIGK